LAGGKEFKERGRDRPRQQRKEKEKMGKVGAVPNITLPLPLVSCRIQLADTHTVTLLFSFIHLYA